MPLFRYCPILQASCTHARVLSPTLTSIEVLSEILHARHTCNGYFLAISNKNTDLRNSEMETKLAIPVALSFHFIC